MKINTEKLSELTAGLVSDVKNGCCKSEIPIAKIDGVLITISAYGRQHAKDDDLENPSPETVCIKKGKA